MPIAGADELSRSGFANYGNQGIRNADMGDSNCRKEEGPHPFVQRQGSSRRNIYARHAIRSSKHFTFCQPRPSLPHRSANRPRHVETQHLHLTCSEDMRVTSRAATCRISSPVIPFGRGTGDPWRTLFSLSLANSSTRVRPSENAPWSPLPLPLPLPCASFPLAGPLEALPPSPDDPLGGDGALPPPSLPAVFTRGGGLNLTPSLTPSIRLFSTALPPACTGRPAGEFG